MNALHGRANTIGGCIACPRGEAQRYPTAHCGQTMSMWRGPPLARWDPGKGRPNVPKQGCHRIATWRTCSAFRHISFAPDNVSGDIQIGPLAPVTRTVLTATPLTLACLDQANQDGKDRQSKSPLTLVDHILQRQRQFTIHMIRLGKSAGAAYFVCPRRVAHPNQGRMSASS